MEENTITKLLEGNVRVVEISALKENPKNPKGISKGQLEKLRKSLGVLGYLIPIIVSKELTIIDGHQRVKALKEEGYERVEVRIVDLDEDSELLALLASDETYGTYDARKRQELYLLLEERRARLDILSNYKNKKEEGKDIEKGTVVPTMEEAEIEYNVPIPLGDHYLICGDSTDPEVWKSVAKIGTPYALITSPPYFNQREYAQWENVQDYLDTMREVFVLAQNTMEDGIWFVDIATDLQYDLPSMLSNILEDTDFTYQEHIAWYKPHPVLDIPRSKQMRTNHLYYPAFSWESCLVYKRGLRHKIESQYINEVVENLLRNVWNMDTVRGEGRIHPAQYPMELPMNAMKCYTSPGDIVVDPFSGSGTTIIAGEEMNRKVVAIELSPEYCALTIKRWNEYVEQKV